MVANFFIFYFKCFPLSEIQFRDGFDTKKEMRMALESREIRVKYKIIFIIDVVLGVGVVASLWNLKPGPHYWRKHKHKHKHKHKKSLCASEDGHDISIS